MSCYRATTKFKAQYQNQYTYFRDKNTSELLPPTLKLSEFKKAYSIEYMEIKISEEPINCHSYNDTIKERRKECISRVPLPLIEDYG